MQMTRRGRRRGRKEGRREEGRRGTRKRMSYGKDERNDGWPTTTRKNIDVETGKKITDREASGVLRGNTPR